MAIGYTGSDGNETSFEYTPVDPQEDMMRQAFEQSQQSFYPAPPQPQGPTPYWENPETYYPRQQQIDPIAQAKAATASAYKYIAMRGYQQDLKEGKSAAESFAKWGPMLVADTSFGPVMKAMTPPVAKPSYTWDEQNQAFMAGGGARPIFRPNAPATKAPTISPLDRIDYQNANGEFDRALKIYTDAAQPEEVKMEARKRMDSAKTRMENIRKGMGQPEQKAADSEPATPAPKQPSAPPAPTVIRLTKDNKKAIFDEATKKFLRYAE